MSTGNKSIPDKQIKIEMSFLERLGKEGGSAQLLQLQGPAATCSAVLIQCSKPGFLIMRSIGCFPAPLSPGPSLSFAPIYPAQSELDSQQFPSEQGFVKKRALSGQFHKSISQDCSRNIHPYHSSFVPSQFQLLVSHWPTMFSSEYLSPVFRDSRNHVTSPTLPPLHLLKPEVGITCHLVCFRYYIVCGFQVLPSSQVCFYVEIQGD